MRIGLDYHGVIDTYPVYFSQMSKALVEKGHDVHIITGHEDTQDFKSLLKSFDMYWTHLFSIVSWHLSIGTPVEYDKKGNPWLDEELWNRSKADYCQRKGVDILIDDSNTYVKYFTDIHTAYIHVDSFNLLREILEPKIMVKTLSFYKEDVIPENYACKKCGATGCKLWRPYQTFKVELLCCDCTAKVGKKDISDMDADGKIKSHGTQRTDTIEWYVPAVPSLEEEKTYWGYSAVPAEGVQWWRNLPNRNGEKGNVRTD